MMENLLTAWLAENCGGEVLRLSIRPVEPTEDAPDATHFVRFAIREDGLDLVDGDEWLFQISGDRVVLLTEPDRPAFCGGTVDEAIRWVDEGR